MLVDYRNRLERIRSPSTRQKEDLCWIRANPPEDKMEELRLKFEWDRILIRGGALAKSANGTVGPGPRFHLIRDYEANKQDMMDKMLRISVTTGQIVPWTYPPDQEIPSLPPREPLTRREVENRKTWCFNLDLGAQRARLEAVKRLRGIWRELTEEQLIDYNYLKDLLQ